MRGWLLLETCIPSDEIGKRMSKAATKNKLTYQEIRSALTDQQPGNRNRGYGGYYGETEFDNDDDYDESGMFQDVWHEEDWWHDSY